jgi:hypothetical protein
MTESITLQYVETTRLCLIDMCRQSQRCVDYAIKSFQLGRPEIYANARENSSEMDTLQRDVTEYALEIFNMGLADDEQLRFAVSSVRIAVALRAMHRSAGEIAAESARIFDDCAEMASEDPGKLGDLANRLVRLCTVALFEETIEHAGLVLRANRNAAVFGAMFLDWYKWNQRVPGIHAHSALAVMRNLNDILQQAHEMADAIAFWLREHCQDLPDGSTEPEGWDHLGFSIAEMRANAIESLAVASC